MKKNKQETVSFVLCCLGVAALSLSLGTQAAFAAGGVDDPILVFQLESNVTSDASICFSLTDAGASLAEPADSLCPTGYDLVTFGENTDDWANIADDSDHALATSFISTEEVINSTGDTIFTGGGSKDINGINPTKASARWEWKNGKPQGKDDIEHAFAAAYRLPGVVNGVPDTCGGTGQPACDTAIYFGMTRWDNSGDAAAGFWFLQDSSTALSENTGTPPVYTCSAGSGCAFTGHHTNGDLLIVSDFSTGGVISDIKVFTWECTGTGVACDDSGSLVQKTELTAGATCNPILGNSNLCAIVNGTPGLSVPFGFTNKSGENTLDHGELLEGGINLNAIFGSNIPCFSTFMAETRASTTPNSTLSDLTPPVSFPLCGMSISKSCKSATVQAGGAGVDYVWTVTVKNTGIGALYDVTVKDTLPDASTQDYNVVTGTNSLGPNESASVEVTYSGTSLSATNIATAEAFSQQSGGGTKVTPATSASATCTATVAGALTVTKHCDATHGGPVLEANDNGFVVVNVPFTAQVCNNGDEKIEDITLSDDPAANTIVPSTAFSLAPGDCQSVTGDYYPSSIDAGDGTDPGRYFFTDELTATGTGVLGKTTISNKGAVSCPICSKDQCTTTTLP